MSTSSFANVLEAISRQRGVRASLIVSESDGLIVDAALRFGQDGVGLPRSPPRSTAKRGCRRGRRGSAVWRFSSSTRMRPHLRGRRPGDLIIVVVAEPAANVG
jgi:hypothetical protein